jgi:uncharacterized membrane protein YhdT
VPFQERFYACADKIVYFCLWEVLAELPQERKGKYGIPEKSRLNH